MTARRLILAAVSAWMVAGAPVGGAKAAEPLAQAVPCLPCHSVAGMLKKPKVPSILGQDTKYLIHQITAFQRQFAPNSSSFLRLERKHPVMSQEAPKVEHEDIALVAEYFASQACVNAWQLDGNRTAPLPKPLLANRCFLCHGQGGRTTHAFVPSLAGQRHEYLQVQLVAFRDSMSEGPSRPGRYRAHRMMTRQGEKLTDAQIDELSAYFSSQRCR